MHKKLKWTSSLSSELLRWFLLLSIIPLVIVSFLAYSNSSKSLIQASQSELKHSANSYKQFITNWFYYRNIDVNHWASLNNTRLLMQTLNQDFKQAKLPLTAFIQSQAYQTQIKKYDQDLLHLPKQYDYLYDLFLFDKQGNLLFTAAKENDLGTNFLTGKYASTKFASILKKTLHDGQTHFSDLEFYSPSKNKIYSFLSTPILNDKAEVIGVFAIQLKPNRIFENFKIINHEDNGIFHYLINPQDLTLRSAITSDSEILTRKIQTEQTQTIKIQHLHHEETDDKVVTLYTGPNKVPVLGLHNSIDILDVKWALISEIDEKVALTASHELAYTLTLFTLFATFILILLSQVVSKRITRPISKLANISQNIIHGNREPIDIDEENEIGLLADTFTQMVDELRQKETTALLKSRETSKALFELKEQQLALNAHSIVAITDVKGTITYVNDKFVEISGYSSAELIGNNHRILQTDEQDEAFWKEMYNTISHGYIWNAEIKNRAKDGHFYWVDTTIVPFLDESGKPESYIAIRTDITEQKNNEIELLSAKEGAEAALEAKGEFLASMSHEIRTPMNGVIGMLNLLKNSKLDEVQAHRLSLAESSAQSLLSLINDILDFSKVEAGKLVLEELEFNLRDELGDFAEAIGHKAQENDIELILDLKEVEHPLVLSDPGRLRQILSNLVGNAIKFTHDGEILIRAKLEETKKNRAKLSICIKDTGIGIPPEKLGTLFDTFTQVDASTTRKYGGTGLGLSIVKRLCELMGGSVHVESTLDKGSTFSFDILVDLPEHQNIVMPSVDIKGKRVLIVDDNLLNREVLSGQLKHWGMEVFEAEDAESCLDLCAQELAKSFHPPFDIALIDMQMPKMDGAQLGKKLQNTPAYEEMKLVMMTSLGSRSDALSFKELGFSAFFPKPTTTKDLFKALNILIDNAHALQNSDNFLTKDKIHTITEENPWPKDMRILLVEDNLTNQIVAQGILETFGLEAEIANNGQEALDLLKQTHNPPFSLILMDCQMPIMDGYEATKAIRSCQLGKKFIDIPIIAMTANAMKGDKEKCMLTGMNHYISKPINPDKLKEAIIRFAHTKTTQEEEIISWDTKEFEAHLNEGKVGQAKVIKAYLDTSVKVLKLLKRAVEENHIDEIEKHAHNLRVEAQHISAKKLSHYLQDLEASLKPNNSEKIQKQFEDIQLESVCVKEGLLRYLG